MSAFLLSNDSPGLSRRGSKLLLVTALWRACKSRVYFSTAFSKRARAELETRDASAILRSRPLPCRGAFLPVRAKIHFVQEIFDELAGFLVVQICADDALCAEYGQVNDLLAQLGHHLFALVIEFAARGFFDFLRFCLRF